MRAREDVDGIHLDRAEPGSGRAHVRDASARRPLHTEAQRPESEAPGLSRREIEQSASA